MPITALPTPPSRQDPANFAARGDALLSALPTFVTEANALQTDFNSKQAAISGDKTQTGEDRIATGQDRSATKDDRAQTGLDRTATGQDRGQALIHKNAASVSEANSTNSANLAANNVQTQLAAVKAQTEAVRDQALAGLGAADQSQNLVLLAAGLQHALDVAGQAADWPINVARGEALLAAVGVALDLAGIAAKQVGGGNVQLAAGTLAEPSLWTAGDRNTGLMFPATDTVALVTAGLERLRVDASGNLGIGTNAPSGLLDLNDNRLRVRSAKTPVSATASGNAGEICWDAGFVYVCTATNVWRRTALTTW